MRKILVCQHVPYEILGTLDPLLRNAGYRIKYVNFGRDPHARPELDGYHGLIVLGGPMNVDQAAAYPHIATEIDLVKCAVDRGLPVLGICLGAQIISSALGGEVFDGVDKEIGWYDVSLTEAGKGDPVFLAATHTEKIFQWHGQTFSLPDGAVHLASSQLCANQAFRYGDNVYGFQFHLEVDEPMIARWLRVPAHVAEIEALGGVIDPERIREDTPSHIDRLKELSDGTFGAVIELFGRRERRHVVLPSR